MMLPPIPPQVTVAAAKAGKELVTILGPAVLKQGLKLLDTNSKVKRGAFQDCSIEMFGDKACIVVNENSGEVVMLTSDTIQSYRYVKEKKKLGGKGYHTYFYYDITFKDGNERYVRMRRKYLEAIERYA